MVGANCPGIFTSDVLVKGLSRGAIATRKLNGVNRDKGHGVYTGSAPYGEGKSLRSSFEWDCLCLDYQGAKSLDLALEKLFRGLNRRRVIPLYTEVDAQRLYRVPAGL